MNFNFNLNTRGTNYGTNNGFKNYTHDVKKEINRYLFNGAEDFRKTTEDKTSINALGMMISDIVADVIETATKNAEETKNLETFEMLADNSHKFDERF